MPLSIGKHGFKRFGFEGILLQDNRKLPLFRGACLPNRFDPSTSGVCLDTWFGPVSIPIYLSFDLKNSHNVRTTLTNSIDKIRLERADRGGYLKLDRIVPKPPLNTVCRIKKARRL